MNNKEHVYDEFEGGEAICLDRNPEGYYLDKDNFYKECFEKCKFCYGAGNEINHQCSECKGDYIFLNEPLFKYNCYEKYQYYYYFKIKIMIIPV